MDSVSLCRVVAHEVISNAKTFDPICLEIFEHIKDQTINWIDTTPTIIFEGLQQILTSQEVFFNENSFFTSIF
jgi:hypothetical protein